MLLLLKITVTVLLVVAVQYVDGNQRVLNVCEFNDKGYFTSGEGDDNPLHCAYGNCSCNSIDYVLGNLNTSNVLVNITTDVMLASLFINELHLENVSIIGHRNPTVNCKDVGGIHFKFCHNCIIEGITWNGCGAKHHSKPVLELSSSSNITIKNCTFQYSKGQAVVLSGVVRDVNIDHCYFVKNEYYRGHGAAIHYSIRNALQISFQISNCYFNYNKGAKSLVRIKSHSRKLKITLHNSKFCHNQGISVCVMNHNIHLTGKVLFQNNTADNGAGIYITDNSTCVFGKNSDVTFIQNSVNKKGGAVFMKDSSMLFDHNSIAIFNNNYARRGGAVYFKAGSSVTFQETCKVIFSNNSAKYGAAIYSFNANYDISNANNEIQIKPKRNSYDVHDVPVDSITIRYPGIIRFTLDNIDIYDGEAPVFYFNYISFKGNSSAVFSSNNANNAGGAIYCKYNNHIYFENNSSTVFSNNSANWYGGAIYSNDNSYISFLDNSSTVFSNNNAEYGGAIHSHDNSHISFEGNSSTVLRNNRAINGGAIHTYYHSNVSFTWNSYTLFSNNIANDLGGAIYSQDDSYISFQDNSSAVFSYNNADYGGAIHSYNNSKISFQGSSFTVLSSNSADINGGAILSNAYSNISFEGNSFALLSNNNAKWYGGAIHCYDNSVSFEVNSSTVFSGNSAENGGAVYSGFNSSISFEGSSSTIFSNNNAKYGAAILVEIHVVMHFIDNCSVAFTNNKATFGATVFSSGNSKIKAIGQYNVSFNDISAKWCKNTCLPYNGEGDVTIDSNGIIWCSDPKAFVCLSKKCYCKKMEDLLDGLESNKSVNITDAVTLSSAVDLYNLSNISIIGYNNLTVICVKGGGLNITDCNRIIIEGVTWIRCGVSYNPSHFTLAVISLFDSLDIIIQKSTFRHSLAPAIFLYKAIQDVNINHCNFINQNRYYDHGASIYCDSYSINGVLVFAINNCYFGYISGKSVVYLNSKNQSYTSGFLLNNSIFKNNRGISFYLSNGSVLHIIGEDLFENNFAEKGAGIYVNDNSTVVFDKNSNVNFINNTVDHSGAAIFQNFSSVIFDQNSLVTFNDNKATNGTIYSKASSNVTFKATCNVTFIANIATQCGAAIYSFDISHVIFTGNSTVTFSNNVVSSTNTKLKLGGTIFSKNHGSIYFKENSVTMFNNNTADYGAAILSFYKSNISFEGRSKVTFNNNVIQSCGVLTSLLYSSISFTDNTKVFYNANTVLCTLFMNRVSSSGCICTFQRANVTFSGHSLVTFINNNAVEGGAVVFSESNISIEKDSKVKFNNNIALDSSGGAFVCYNNTTVMIKGNSNVTFSSNNASRNGGAIHSYNMCKIRFMDNSTSIFTNNSARNKGGAIFSGHSSEVDFGGNSSITFDHNTADNGGTFYLTNSTIRIQEMSIVSFHNNEAKKSGGVGYLSLNSVMIVDGKTRVRFDSNVAEQNAGVLYSARSNILFKSSSVSYNITFHHNSAFNGGAILVNDHSNITLTGNSVLSFVSNEAAQSGGAGYFNTRCNFVINENAMVAFYNNKAMYGGAVFGSNKTKFLFQQNSTAVFCHNLATVNGGAVSVMNDTNITLKDYTTVKFINNSAQYGGAVFLDATAVMVNNSDESCTKFKDNIARIIGSLVYQDVAQYCNSSCLYDRIPGINTELIATPPNELKFYDPAICIDNDNETQCNNYYIQNIMLGREIVIPACVLDYYNRSVDSTQFLIQSEIHPNYFISGPKQALISCDTFEGISIIGNKNLLKPMNFSVDIILNTAFNTDWKQISLHLIIEISPCHLGFWQYPESKTCECYNADDIVFCSGSNSTIKRGFWFGSVTGKPTVTFCPINYCNFTCCETSNGYYHLSPARDNQCRSHRSGTACGSCTDGYTLSFDSTKCVNVENCTVGQTVQLILFTVIYWIVMVTLVFAMMYYKVGIGYLYSITYYYSIVDILLSQNVQASGSLYLAINIMSSFSKLTPQFLGELCLISGMSGIDQQFIHYIHPTAVITILVIISLLARISRRISVIISRGIIHVICLLLLLSYTSMGSTSLLLMRSLTFHEIDKVYTYLSPDTEYFHGRHLAYGIVALLCTVSIVIGLPLLLTLEPFLNHQFNFTKIKPLLDQFQGCYKDKYRCFASYYMICRVVIITVVIINSANDFVAHYMLIIICGIIALIHVTVRPYNIDILNKLDGVILHLIIFITALPLLNDFDSPLVISMAFVLVIVPLLNFIGMTLFLHKDNLKNIVTTYFTIKNVSPKSNDVSNGVTNNEIPTKEFDLIVDDSMRENATICDM